MADNNLPPLNEEPTEETVINEGGITRPNRPMPPQDDTEQNRKHRTELLRKTESTRENRKAPTGSHVQPIRTSPKQANQGGYTPRPRRRRNKQPQDSALYLPWWSIALMLVGVIIVSFAVVGGVIFLGGSGNFLAEPSPIIMVVTADQSAISSSETQSAVQQAPSTEIISGQNAPANLDLQGPTLAPVQLSATPAAIQIGSVVIVEGVDLNTLNVRSIPSLTDSSILFRAEEGEIFNVIDGPQSSDGFTWWQVQDPADVNRIGWAVSNFLTVQAP